MKPVISHQVPISSVHKGDSIIGSDTKAYLVSHIEEVWLHGQSVGMMVEAIAPNGESVKTTVALNACVDAILQRAQGLDTNEAYIGHALDRMAGFKRCTNCNEMRSKRSEWDETDYICKVCRHVLDSGA